MASTVSSTTLSFGLVSAPVAVKKVKEAESSFSTVDAQERPVGQVWAVKSEMDGKQPCVPTDPEAIELVPFVPNDKGKMKQDTRKAVDLGGGVYREVPAEAVKAIDESCSIEGIEITKFIPLADVPLQRVEGCYFVAPQKGMAAAKKPLALLREAMQASGRAGIGKLSFRTKQRPFVIYAQDGGLILNTLVFAQDFAQVAEAAEVLAGVEVDAKHVTMATTLVEALAGGVEDLDALYDEARELREELIAKAIAGEVIEAPEKAEQAEATVDLEAALLASIGDAAPAPAKKKATKPKAKVAA